VAYREEEPGLWVLRRVLVLKSSLLIEMARRNDGRKMVLTDRVHSYAGAADWLTHRRNDWKGFNFRSLTPSLLCG
jgi:hypothetical protein